MKTWVYCATIVLIIFASISQVFANSKNNHCVVADNLIRGNLISANFDAFFHLSRAVGASPGGMLFVLPRLEAIKDQPQGVFYYIESVTADCDGWTMMLRNDAGEQAIIVGSAPVRNKCVHNLGCDALNVLIKFGTGIKYEPLSFISTWAASLNGFDTGNVNLDAKQIISKTTLAICSRIFVEVSADYEKTDIFRQCQYIFSGQDYIKKLQNKQ